MYGAAGEHNATTELLSGTGVYTLEIPRRCTHVFQPADMFIISGIKSHTKAGWKLYVQEVFRTSEADEAAVAIVCDSVVAGRMMAPYQRE